MSAIIRLRSYRVAMGAAGERDVHRRPVGDIQNLLCIRRIGGVTRLLKTLHEVIGAAAVFQRVRIPRIRRWEGHPSELQSLMRISYAVFCLQIQNGDVITNADNARKTE